MKKIMLVFYCRGLLQKEKSSLAFIVRALAEERKKNLLFVAVVAAEQNNRKPLFRPPVRRAHSLLPAGDLLHALFLGHRWREFAVNRPTREHLFLVFPVAHSKAGKVSRAHGSRLDALRATDRGGDDV